MARNAEPTSGRLNAASRWNADYIEATYRRWCEDPTSVSGEWRQFFEGFELGMGRAPGACGPIPAEDQSRVASLIYAYRNLGHRIAGTNPLGGNPETTPELDLAGFETVLAGFLARVGAWREIVRQGAPRDWQSQPAVALFGLGPMFGDQVAHG